MKHFLIMKDLSRGLVEVAEFDDEGEALHARFQREREHRDEQGVEVVLVSAPSYEVLRRTHLRLTLSNPDDLMREGRPSGELTTR